MVGVFVAVLGWAAGDRSSWWWWWWWSSSWPCSSAWVLELLQQRSDEVASLPAATVVASVGALLILLLAKALAYAVSLGCGFRGGPVFPAIFIGVAVAMIPAAVFG